MRQKRHTEIMQMIVRLKEVEDKGGATGGRENSSIGGGAVSVTREKGLHEEPHQR